MRAVRSFVRSCVRPSEDFTWSDLVQIWYAASLGDPQNRPVTAFSIRAPGALLQVHHGFLRVEEDLCNETSQQGMLGYFWNRGDENSRMGHVPSYFEQIGVAAQGQGLLGVEGDLGNGTS